MILNLVMSKRSLTISRSRQILGIISNVQARPMHAWEAPGLRRYSSNFMKSLADAEKDGTYYSHTHKPGFHNKAEYVCSTITKIETVNSIFSVLNAIESVVHLILEGYIIKNNLTWIGFSLFSPHGTILTIEALFT
jgi:hypothetical protein